MKKLLQFSHSKSLSLRADWLLLIVLTMSTIITGCKKDFSPPCDDKDSGHGKNKGIIVHKGGSIQAAVDAAAPGETIRIEAGIYNEAIVVSKPGIHLIGFACNPSDKVIIQNPGDEENGITVTDEGDGFVLKNVTVQNFEENGVFLVRVDNFLLSHVVTINNGEYGLFPVLCKNGVVEYCSATGHTDTGIYIGQSENVVVQYNVAYGNVNGLEIENCTDVAVLKNHSYDNVSGLLLVLLPGLTVKTSSNVLVRDNNFENNNHINFADPGGFEAFVPSGSGILLVGVDNATIKNNKISNNNFTGIATVSTIILGALAGLPPDAFADIEPNADGAKITNNLLVNNGTAPPAGLPLPGVDLLWDGNGINNCWKNNSFSTSYPSPLPVCN
ncbi:MAG: parallel beta-helix domain-containing protein [Chitinophagaceae bacterium]